MDQYLLFSLIANVVMFGLLSYAISQWRHFERLLDIRSRIQADTNESMITVGRALQACSMKYRDAKSYGGTE